MSYNGPNSPAAAANDTSLGELTWGNPSWCYSSNDLYSYTSFAPDAYQVYTYSYYLKATNFGFTIPEDSVIKGIVANVERKQAVSNPIYGVSDYAVQLCKAGVLGGTNKAAGGWPSVDTIQQYGSSTDLWGLSLTAEDVMNSGFGIGISAYFGGISSGSMDASTIYAYVDHITLTVYYTPHISYQVIQIHDEI